MTCDSIDPCPELEIDLEYRTLPNGMTLYRWACECGRHGVYLESKEFARRNGGIHREYEHGVAS